MSVSDLETEVKEFKLQLETVVAGLQADPDNTELQNLQKELEEFISLTESSIAELKAVSAPLPPLPPASPPKEKWSKENHPAFQPGYRRPGAPTSTAVEEKDDQPPVFKVNDTVMAKWKSGDKAFYPAKITSITGSSSKPVYIVTFKGYNNTETLFNYEIRPANSPSTAQKRKAEELSVNSGANTGHTQSTAGTAHASAPGVISAAPTVDPALASAARTTAEARAGDMRTLDGPKAKVPKKISNNKALEGAKNKWQAFSAGGKGKSSKRSQKESMFRTGEGVNARVGFTGSGQAMRKDQARTRHIYDQGGDEEV